MDWVELREGLEAVRPSEVRRRVELVEIVKRLDFGDLYDSRDMVRRARLVRDTVEIQLKLRAG